MSEMREYKSFGQIVTCAKKEINGNWYYIVTWPEPMRYDGKYLCIVFAHRDGRRMEWYHPADLSTSGNDLVRYCRKQEYTSHWDKGMDTFVSQAVNDAVCKLEGKQDKTQQFQDSINAALEANAEIHGGIDYQLEQGANE